MLNVMNCSVEGCRHRHKIDVHPELGSTSISYYLLSYDLNEGEWENNNDSSPVQVGWLS